MNENLIQVLWVEDDPEIIKTYPLEAANNGLELVQYNNWQAAEKALESEFKRWSAIILDAKCKYKPDSLDNAAKFLTQAMYSINKICQKRNRIIPWYILSGGSEDEINDLIIDSREQWDGDWVNKKFYSKTTDREILFHRIKYHANISPEMNIRLIEYPDVFNAIRSANLGDEMECYMEDLLKPIHFRENGGSYYNEKMTLVRKCIERIFHSMIQNSILPNKKVIDGRFFPNDKIVDRRGSLNLTWCSKIISGKGIEIDNKTIIKSSKNIVPNVLKDSFKNLIEITSSYEHAQNKTLTEEQNLNSRGTEIFLKGINNAPYLLRGMAMELCNIILWYSNYIYENDNSEENSENWEVID